MNNAHKDLPMSEYDLGTLVCVMCWAVDMAKELGAKDPELDEECYREAEQLADRLIEVHTKGLIRVCAEDDIWTLYSGAELLLHRIKNKPGFVDQNPKGTMQYSESNVRSILADFLNASEHLLADPSTTILRWAQKAGKLD